MKKYLVLFLFVLLLSVSATAQYANTSKVVETTLSKQEMWTNLRTWASLTFQNYEHSVDMEDQDGGVLIIKWKQPCPISIENVNGEIEKTRAIQVMKGIIKVEVKDQKYRYSTLGCESFIDTSKISYFFSSCAKFGNKNIPMGTNELEMALKNELDNTPKYKNAKDEKKNKFSGDYKDAYNRYAFIKMVNLQYNVCLNELIISLQKYMVQSNDF